MWTDGLLVSVFIPHPLLCKTHKELGASEPHSLSSVVHLLWRAAGGWRGRRGTSGSSLSVDEGGFFEDFRANEGSPSRQVLVCKYITEPFHGGGRHRVDLPHDPHSFINPSFLSPFTPAFARVPPSHARFLPRCCRECPSGARDLARTLTTASITAGCVRRDRPVVHIFGGRGCQDRLRSGRQQHLGHQRFGGLHASGGGSEAR